MKLITETIKSKLIKERINFGWDKHTQLMLEELIELCYQLKGEELRNIEEAFRTGWQTTDRWSLNLEIYDHIKSQIPILSCAFVIVWPVVFSHLAHSGG